ncbi:MAG: efflux RND transporter permease subunit, partial [Flavobacteriales bacterium]
GGVVVARYGTNPLEVINNVKDKIKKISGGLPSKKLKDGTTSKVEIVPFYDRTQLIKETIGTLETALSHEILISMLVVIVLVLNLRASLVISGLLPIGVLITFIIMKYAGVTANIVALSGIAIAIGVMVDVGIIITENILRHIDEFKEKQGKQILTNGKELLEVIYNGAAEVSSAVLTALTTTIVSFLPIFAMEGEEGKLFKPLAFTKTFALIAALFIGLLFIPALIHSFSTIKINKKKIYQLLNILLLITGFYFLIQYGNFLSIALIAFGINNLFKERLKKKDRNYHNLINLIVAFATVTYLLALEWMPMGAKNNVLINFLFVLLIIIVIVGSIMLVVKYYSFILNWCLNHKKRFLFLCSFLIILGVVIWQGFNKVFGFISTATEKVGIELNETESWQTLNKTFPGISKEFMPPLDEGSFLLMPTTMPHSGVEENIDVIRSVDKRIKAIPEVTQV